MDGPFGTLKALGSAPARAPRPQASKAPQRSGPRPILVDCPGVSLVIAWGGSKNREASPGVAIGQNPKSTPVNIPKVQKPFKKTSYSRVVLPSPKSSKKAIARF